MNVHEACTLINDNLAVKPGWHVHAQPAGGAEVWLRIWADTWDSSPQYAPGYERGRQIKPGGYRSITVSRMDNTLTVAAKVLREMLGMEIHEWREFFRVKAAGRWVAPFHPHRYDGRRAFGALDVTPPQELSDAA